VKWSRIGYQHYEKRVDDVTVRVWCDSGIWIYTLADPRCLIAAGRGSAKTERTAKAESVRWAEQIVARRLARESE
jgi:hypothetical protein